MKKSLLVAVLIAAFCQVKAQQLFPVKPVDSLKNSPLQKYFNIKPGIQQQLFQSQGNLNQILASVNMPVKVDSYDHTPIAFLPGNSKMPVVKLGGYYKMPVAKLGGEGSSTVEVNKITP
jgi:hypothetical protein